MKSVFILASSWAVLTAQGITVEPADSLKISKDVSLDEVVVTATKVAKGTPVAYSELTQDELKRRNDGQGIPYLILQSPSVIMTSDAYNEATDILTFSPNGYRLLRFPHSRNRCQPYQYHSQRSTRERLGVAYRLLGEYARFRLFG